MLTWSIVLGFFLNSSFRGSIWVRQDVQRLVFSRASQKKASLNHQDLCNPNVTQNEYFWKWRILKRPKTTDNIQNNRMFTEYSTYLFHNSLAIASKNV